MARSVVVTTCNRGGSYFRHGSSAAIDCTAQHIERGTARDHGGQRADASWGELFGRVDMRKKRLAPAESGIRLAH